MNIIKQHSLSGNTQQNAEKHELAVATEISLKTSCLPPPFSRVFRDVVSAVVVLSVWCLCCASRILVMFYG
jgi:hypothetical protein